MALSVEEKELKVQEGRDIWEVWGREPERVSYERALTQKSLLLNTNMHLHRVRLHKKGTNK